MIAFLAGPFLGGPFLGGGGEGGSFGSSFLGELVPTPTEAFRRRFPAMRTPEGFDIVNRGFFLGLIVMPLGPVTVKVGFLGVFGFFG